MVLLRQPDLVLILHGDRLSAEALRQTAAVVFAGAEVYLATCIDDADRVLKQRNVAWFICGLSPALAGDPLDFIATSAVASGGPKILVVAPDCDDHAIAVLRSLPVKGIFDSGTQGAGELEMALRHLAAGRWYWSPRILERILRQHVGSNSIFRRLTAFERIVLTVLGGGNDDASAAAMLDVSPETIGSVRRDLHRKLGVQHRGELIRVAAQTGFVHFTPAGIVRPGFAVLSQKYRCTRKKRRRMPAVARSQIMSAPEDILDRATGIPVSAMIGSTIAAEV